MAQGDYYKILGVDKNADEAELKKAYRRLAMKYHPDRNPDDKDAEAKFKEAKLAYEVLNDPQKRKIYDQYGAAGLEGAHAGAQGGGRGFGDIFGDVFGDIFGQAQAGGRQNYATRGQDLQYNMELSLEEAVQGVEKKVQIPTSVHCEVCNGSGAKAGTKPKPCGKCQGSGQIHMQQGFFAVQQTCPDCRGRGEIIEQACSACHGQGKKRETKTLNIKVPQGIDTGDRIRLSGEGEAGDNGGPNGDLYVQMHIKEHPIFERDGANLHTQVPLSFATAALGGDLEVPTLDGRVKIKIPEGTQTGKMFRLRGKGVKPARGGTVGDILCQVEVETPVKLNKVQKELLKDFDLSLQKAANKHNPRSGGWMDGVKKFFDDMRS